MHFRQFSIFVFLLVASPVWAIHPCLLPLSAMAGNPQHFLPQPVVRTERRLGPAGGPYEDHTLEFPNALYVSGEGGAPPELGGAPKDGYIYDCSASSRPIGPGDPYTGNTYGAVDTQRAIQRYLQTKNFQDGTLDLFVVIRPGDPEPPPDLARAYEIVNFFGTTPGAAGRNGPRGMRRNPEARRNIRLFILEAGPGRTLDLVPASCLQMASDLSHEFGVDVAVSNRFVDVHANGSVTALGPPGPLHPTSGEPSWVLFSPQFAR